MDKDKNLNRIKAVLAEKHVTSKWLAEQLGKSTCTVSNGARKKRSRICRPSIKFPNYLM